MTSRTASVLIGVVLAVLSYSAASIWWQYRKRGTFLKSAVNDPTELDQFISKDSLVSPPSHISIFAQKDESSYAYNLKALLDADRTSQLWGKLLMGAAGLGLLVGSYFVGEASFWTNIALFCLAGVQPLGGAAKGNAVDHILSMALILFRWRKENQRECEAWIERGWSLKTLYAVVGNVAGENLEAQRDSELQQTAQSMVDSISHHQPLLAHTESADRLRHQSDSQFEPETLDDLIIVGGYHIQKGTTEFTEWSQAMIEDLGEWVKPHLNLLYDTIGEGLAEVEADEQPAEKENLVKAWRPSSTASGSSGLTVPYNGRQEMTRNLYEMLMEDRLKELIDEDPKQARILFTNNPEHNPNLYEIAMGNPSRHWPAQIMACDQMMIYLNQIDWSREGQTFHLLPSELPSLWEITETLPG